MEYKEVCNCLTYDALNRLTFIDRPGTTNDTTYTYDSRGNRTQMQTGSVTNYLTFNAADELTRVDKPSNAYDTYTYDNNGNCTSMNVFYPQPLLASKNTENDKTYMRVHYPADYAPAPVNKWRNLSPYLPDVSVYGTMSELFARLDPKKAKWDREERWRELCMPLRDPDESTSLTYSSDNNLTHADLPNGNDLDFAYDAAGRRVEKKLTSTSTNNNTTTTTVTTYKYHYIGSQITTIEIDQTQDSGEGPVVTKDDEMRIHLGANSRPISFEYYTENQGTQQTTSATYYYHYDLHGNVIRVTNSSGSTVIQYTYDQLGTIVSETNSSSIYNPFTYMGEAQVIHDVEFDTSTSSPKTGLYNSGSGYYNPETGTFLQGAGIPLTTNPISVFAEMMIATESNPAQQQLESAQASVVDGGCSVGYQAAMAKSVAPEQAYSGFEPQRPSDMMQPEGAKAKLFVNGQSDEPPYYREPYFDPISLNPEPEPDPGKHLRTDWENWWDEWKGRLIPGYAGGDLKDTADPVYLPECYALDDDEVEKQSYINNPLRIIEPQMPQDSNNTKVGTDGDHRSGGGMQLCGGLSQITGTNHNALADDWSGGGGSGGGGGGGEFWVWLVAAAKAAGKWLFEASVAGLIGAIIGIRITNKANNDDKEYQEQKNLDETSAKIQNLQDKWFKEWSNNKSSMLGKLKTDFKTYFMKLLAYARDLRNWLEQNRYKFLGDLGKYGVVAVILEFIKEYNEYHKDPYAYKNNGDAFRKWILEKLKGKNYVA